MDLTILAQQSVFDLGIRGGSTPQSLTRELDSDIVSACAAGVTTLPGLRRRVGCLLGWHPPIRVRVRVRVRVGVSAGMASSSFTS